MKLKDVEAEVERITTLVGDPERLHGAEDTLHCNVLEAIAEGARNPAKLAAAALKTLEIECSRWYA